MTLDEEKRRALREFCLVRNNQEGGFGATPYLPPTIEDTYFALNILAFLGEDLPAPEKTLTFLKNKAQASLSPRLSFYLKVSFLVLGEEAPPLKTTSPRTPTLEDIFYLKKLGKLKGQKLPGLSPRPTLKELYFLSGTSCERAKPFVPYVLSSQNPDGGFGFFPGTTSFIENTYFALNFLKTFGLLPNDLEGLKNFVYLCWRKEAFARAPGGIPFLESSFYALKILAFLKKASSL